MDCISFTQSDIVLEKMLYVIENKTIRDFLPFRSGRHADGLIYITMGKTAYEFEDGTQFTVSKGDILFLPKGSVYSMNILTENFDYIFVDFFFDSSKKFKPEYFKLPESYHCEHAFRAMLMAWSRNENFSITESKMFFYKICSKIQKFLNHNYTPQYKKQKLIKAIDYIEENFTKNIFIPDLAKQCNVSEVHFRRLFLEVYKTTPQKYIISKRIRTASELLQFSNNTISNIAKSSGFSSVYYFCRLFKTETGMTPSEYRDSMQDIS